MINLRDFPYNCELFGLVLGHIMTPVLLRTQEDFRIV